VLHHRLRHLGRIKLGLVLCRKSKTHPVFDRAEGPRGILIRFSLYQRMYESTTSMNCSRGVPF
jgi:hypothetical protein